MITLQVSSTKMLPEIGIKYSIFIKNDESINVAPKKSEPESPINNFAG